MSSFPHNQVIGNQGAVDPNRSYHNPHQGAGNMLTTNAFGQGQGGFGGGGYPTPYQQQPPSGGGGGGLASFFSGGGGGGGSGFNFAQLKQIVDRMGGIEGVISTLGKVQKMVGTFQQMAPMLKLLIPPKKSAGGTGGGSTPAPIRKRRRSSGKKRRPSGKRRSRR
jgi:hypothetical protein